MWTAKVASEDSLLRLAIDHPLHTFGQDCLKPVHSEAVQALLELRTRRIRAGSQKVAKLPGAKVTRGISNHGVFPVTQMKAVLCYESLSFRAQLQCCAGSDNT